MWRALTEQLEPDSNFEDFRTAMLDVRPRAVRRGRPGRRGVDEAFATVGLDGSWEAPEQEGC